MAAAGFAEDAEETVVESVDVVNNQFLPRDTLLFYVSTKAGDRSSTTFSSRPRRVLAERW